MIYPIGMQDFEDLRKRGFAYVDKTDKIYRLAATGKYYFMSRPRRFGKSLLLSTMEAYFSGKRELFEGLALEKLERKWTKYPVLYLDLNTGRYGEDERGLESVLNNILERWEEEYGNGEGDVTLVRRFENIVERAYFKTGRQVVILIDEYNKPMLQSIGNEALQERYRSMLEAFYYILKPLDRYIQFAFITGVTNFGKENIPDNFEDISMNEDYADICGITEKELHENFDEPIRELAKATGETFDQTCDILRKQYGGYHFEHDTEEVYNLSSLHNSLSSQSFKNYWFENGTPTFLVKLLQQSNYNLDDLENKQVCKNVLRDMFPTSLNPVSAIYQSGYLTIKEYDEEIELYRLGFPNEEVETGFTSLLLPMTENHRQR